MKAKGEHEESMFIQGLLDDLNIKWRDYLFNIKKKQYVDKANLIREKLALYQEFIYYLENVNCSDDICVEDFLHELDEWLRIIDYKIDDDNARNMIYSLINDIMIKYSNKDIDNNENNIDETNYKRKHK